MQPRSSRTVAVLIVGALVALSALAWVHVQSFGFPDGHLTDLERAERKLMPVFVGLNLTTAAWLLVLSWIDRSEIVRRLLLGTVLVYVVLVLGLLGLDLKWRATLNSGAG